MNQPTLFIPTILFITLLNLSPWTTSFAKDPVSDTPSLTSTNSTSESSSSPEKSTETEQATLSSPHKKDKPTSETTIPPLDEKDKPTSETTTSKSPELQALETELETFEMELKQLELENKKLTTENLIQSEKYKKDLLELQQQREKLLLQNEVLVEQNRQALAQTTAAKEKLQLENELGAQQQTQTLAHLEAIKSRLELENTLAELNRTKQLADLEYQLAELTAKNSLQQEKNRQEELELELKNARLSFKMNELEMEKTQKLLETEVLERKIMKRDLEEIWDAQVNQPMVYSKDPYSNNQLIITDRRINLGTVIFPDVAEYVSERIHYFNNKNPEYPIFLVIDRCYGGSIVEGSRILEIMQNSQAPIYVVVKSLAASMCAVLATLSKHSFAYPNAVIVHHQVFSLSMGTTRELKEHLSEVQEWTKRILQPVAEKMGLTMEEFVNQMYAHNSIGDWQEFADQALKLKWIDTVVGDIREHTYRKQPVDKVEEENEDITIDQLTQKTDAQGQTYLELPKLGPLDFYYLYNPTNYFR